MKVLEIDKKDFKNNIKLIKNLVGNDKDDNGNKAQIIAVVKANGMGLGLLEETKFLSENGITFFAVSTVEEAVKLRNANKDCKILMLSPVNIKKEIEALLDSKVIFTIGSMTNLKNLEKVLEARNETAEAHLKIDTGLARYGFLSDNPEYLEVYEQAKRVKLTGMFTHFSNPINKKWTNLQFRRFLDVVETIKLQNYEPGLLHCASSTAFLKYPEMCLNAVRIGSAFQGRVLVKNYAFKKLGTFKTNIEEIKNVPKGYTISYGNTYKVKRDSKIAIIPVGYKDGLFMQKARDNFSFIENIKSVGIEIKKIFKDNNCYVEIAGNKYRIIGRNGMYHTVIDITGANVNIGDEVIINIPPLMVNDNIKREYN